MDPVVLNELLELIELAKATMNSNIEQRFEERHTLHGDEVSAVGVGGDGNQEGARKGV